VGEGGIQSHELDTGELEKGEGKPTGKLTIVEGTLMALSALFSA